MRHRLPTLPSRADLLLVVALALLLPAAARAWGPAAHIDFGAESLRWLALAAPAVRRLLQAYPGAYLYGAFVADAVIGKNRAPEPLHCHRWAVGRSLLAAAADPVERAFSLGYLAHLAADEVAHRRFVPAKMVEAFAGRALRHVYWELRFDARVLHERPEVGRTWQEVVRRKPKGVHRFLAAHLHPALLSHATSRRLFQGTMLLQRRPAWQRAADRIDRTSPYPLTPEEFRLYRERAVDAVLAFLSDPDGERTPAPDAVGAAELDEARRLRRVLRAALRRDALPPDAQARLAPALLLAASRNLPLAPAVRQALGPLAPPEVTA